MTMDHVKTTTPPTTPSRASTALLDNQARTTPTMRPIGVMTNDAHDFKPHQMLMQTTISIEYGEDLTSQQTMHEEILRCHSHMFDLHCLKAKPLREQYAKSTAIKDRLASFVFPEVTEKQFANGAMEPKVIPVILEIYEKYPFAEHHKGLRKVVEDAVDAQIALKNTTPDPSPKGHRGKDSRDMSRAVSIATRLGYLTPQGVYGVATAVFAKLHLCAKQVRAAAQQDPVWAAAQRRLLLPEVEDTAVKALVQWIYQGTLCPQDAAHLYALLDLTTKLGVEALSEICLTRLAVGFSDAIQQARSTGIPLHTLLDHGQQPANRVVEVVLLNVFKDEGAPTRLLDLVVETLADNLDKILWTQLKDLIGHGMAVRLIDALIDRQHIKVEPFGFKGVKIENGDAATERSLPVVNNNHQLPHVG